MKTRWFWLSGLIFGFSICSQAQQTTCADDQIHLILSCQGRHCFGQYSPGDPIGSGQREYSYIRVNCCSINVNIWQPTGASCPYRGAAKIAQKALRNGQSIEGLHFLISNCRGNLLPLEEGQASLKQSPESNWVFPEPQSGTLGLFP